MTRQERQTFEDEAIRTGTLTAFRLGKIIAMDECIELLNSFIKDDFNIALEIASIQFNMKKNYDSRFSLQQAVYGARVRLVCDKPYYYVANSSFSYE